MDSGQEMLQYKAVGDRFVKHIYTGGKSWVYCFQPEMKGQSKNYTISHTAKTNNSTYMH
jgi:hypothetical protein